MKQDSIFFFIVHTFLNRYFKIKRIVIILTICFNGLGIPTTYISLS